MKTPAFVHRSHIAAPAEAVFAWHARPGSFQRLAPPWERVRVLEQTGGIREGGRVVLEVRIGPRWVRWVAVHSDYVEGRQFRDTQVEGPFAHWVHTHRVEPDGPGASILEDQVEYALPCGGLGRALGGRIARRMLRRMFAYRHTATQGDVETHQRMQQEAAMHIAVTGSTGLIGSALVPFLTVGGHRVSRLVRGHAVGLDCIRWDPAKGVRDVALLEGLDGLVHLAGENIAGGRWTAARKAAIHRSRVEGTQRLCEVLARLARPPRVLVCASAIGYYGDRGDQVLMEEAPPGNDFLALVCREWEEAAAAAAKAGIRVVNLRFGIVLSPAGGALRKMLLPFRLGAGGRIGNGRQYWSWIALDDVMGAIHHALVTGSLGGAVNAVAPSPVTNAEFTRVLGRVLRRPAITPLPAFAARILLGEMADALLLASTRVMPKRLQETDYRFRHPDLEGALRHLLGRTP